MKRHYHIISINSTVLSCVDTCTYKEDVFAGIKVD